MWWVLNQCGPEEWKLHCCNRIEILRNANFRHELIFVIWSLKLLFVCFSEANFTTPWLGISARSEETDEENASCRESAMIKLSNSLPQKAKKTDWRRSPRDAFHSRTRRNAEEERFDGNCKLGSVLLRRRHLNTQAVLREYECVSAHLR